MKGITKKTGVSWITALLFIMLVPVLSSQVYSQVMGWCCVDGVVFTATPEQCKEKGGVYFATEEEAKKYCEQGDRGWCCLDGAVFVATPEQCKEKGGMWFPTEAEARKYCDQGDRGWCCLDGAVFVATPEQCKEKGGIWFPTEAEARKYCDQGDRGWCCLDGAVFVATPEQCKEKGGTWFPTEAEARKYCESGNELPDLKIVKIELNRACQVVVTVKNAGPGSVPDTVWTIHTPSSSSVYIHKDGSMWGGATIWKFDPGKSLKSPGGTAVYVSRLVVASASKIRATIDHTSKVAEVNEMNNELTVELKCGEKMPKARRLK